MKEQVVKIIPHPDGKRRVLIVRRENGFYGFEEEKFSDEPLEMTWLQFTQNPYSICDSPEAAEHEARGRVGWLMETS